MTEFTHEIIRMERGQTKGSNSPMWRCQTADGQRVNVFQHSDPNKDSATLFIAAGYFDFMSGLQVGEAVEWTGAPIRVAMSKDGDWWKVVAVADRAAGAEPDVLWRPDLEAYRKRAYEMALQIMSQAVRVLDVETTGLRADDEIVAIAVLDENSGVRLESLVKPSDVTKLLRPGKNGMVATEINGIAADDLADAPTFVELWPQVFEALEGAHWCAYNAAFDVAALDRACSDAGMPLLLNSGVFDAAKLVAEYLGNWNEKRQWFENLTLADAIIELGGSPRITHQARADAELTLELLRAIARGVPVAKDLPF